MHVVVSSRTCDPQLSSNSCMERAGIAAPLPVPPTKPIAWPSRVTPTAHAAC
jgi:hypothetical protein